MGSKFYLCVPIAVCRLPGKIIDKKGCSALLAQNILTLYGLFILSFEAYLLYFVFWIHTLYGILYFVFCLLFFCCLTFVFCISTLNGLLSASLVISSTVTKLMSVDSGWLKTSIFSVAQRSRSDVSHSVCLSVCLSMDVSRLDWCDPGEWWYL